MMGAPKHHIFFEPVIKIVVYISIPIYIYMILQGALTSYIIGGLGILIALLILLLLKIAPKKAEENPGIVNFVSAIGFFYIFLFYHLVVSFSLTSDNLSSFMVDTLLLLLITLYIVQSLTRRISDSPERLKAFENPVRFQTRLYITDRLKKAFGERGVVIIVMGLVLGYHMAYLDSLFVNPFPILSELFTADLKLSALYHRIYLLFSFFIILGAVFIFYSSNKFRDMMVDKYTAAQLFKYMGSYFMKTEEGVSPFEIGMQELGKKLGEGIKGIGDKWKKSLQDKMAPKPKENDNSLEGS